MTRRRHMIAGMVLAGMIGVLAGAGGFTFFYAQGLSYLSDDPTVCVNCHIMRDPYDAWQKAGHHAVAVCNDCHLPQGLVGRYVAKAENGLHHSKAFTLQNFHEPIRITDRNAAIVQANCVRCHQDFVCRIVSIDSATGYRPDCVRCHTAAGHGPRK